MKTQQEILQGVYKALKITKEVYNRKDLAAKTGIDYTNLITAMQNDRVNFSQGMQRKILRAFPQVNPAFLQKGEGDILISATQLQNLKTEENTRSETERQNEVVLKALEVASKAQELNEQSNKNLATLLDIMKNK